MYSDFRRSNSVVGSHQPPLGPFAPLRPAGYGNPGGIGVNMLRNRPLADGGPGNSLLVYQVIPNEDPARLWHVDDPTVVRLQRGGGGDLGAARSAGPNAATYDGMSAGAASGPSASYGHYSRAS